MTTNALLMPFVLKCSASCNCIIMGYYEQAKDLLNRILQNYYQNPASIQLMKYRGFTLLYTMLDATEKIREKEGRNFLKNTSLCPRSSA